MKKTIFKKILTLRIKYYFYFSDRLADFTRCPSRRPKKLTSFHLMYCFWNWFYVQFQFLKILKYTILSSDFCLFQNNLIDLLTSKGLNFITKKFKMLLCKKKEERALNYKPIFSGLGMYFCRSWYLPWNDGCLLHLKHVSLGFNVYHWLF